MVEELAEGFVRAAWAILRWIVWDLVFRVVLFQVGRTLLLVVTFGRYPRVEDLQRDVNRIAAVGLLFVLGVWAAIATYNNAA